MDLAIVFTVFPIVFVGELPDKTMFASLLMATRGRPLAVWAGGAAAFVVHVAIAVALGAAIVALLPHRAVDALVAAVFLLGALLAVREARRGDHAHADEHVGGHHRTAVTAFAVIFVAEWGDLTQILTADLAARYHAPLAVGLGALLALWTVSGLAVVGGRGITRFVSVTTIRYVTAVALVVLAGLAAWQAAR